MKCPRCNSSNVSPTPNSNKFFCQTCMEAFDPAKVTTPQARQIDPRNSGFEPRIRQIESEAIKLSEKYGIGNRPQEKPKGPAVEAGKELNELYNRTISKVVEIYVPQFHSAGSGFVINEEYIVTNAHVVSERREDDILFADECIVRYGEDVDTKQYPVTVKFANPKEDIAVLQFYHSPKLAKEQHFSFSNSDDLVPGQRVITIGNSLGWGLAINDLVVAQRTSRLPDMERFSEILYLKNDAQHGNSGGPIIDFNGNVVGMLTCGHLEQTESIVEMPLLPGLEVPIKVNNAIPVAGISLAVTSNTIMSLLKKAGIPYTEKK